MNDSNPIPGASDAKTINPEEHASPSIRPVIFKMIAWACWSVFSMASFGLFAFATAVRNNVHFAAYYGHHPMSRFTLVMTTFPVWIALLPLLWLPFIISYQRQRTPKGIFLLPLSLTMFVSALVVFVLILFSGPPIQM